MNDFLNARRQPVRVIKAPFVMDLANKGYKQACQDDAHLLNGLNVHHGHVTCKAVSGALDCAYVEPLTALGI